MANSNTPPRREPELVPWLLNLNTLVQANGVSYGIPAAVSADLNTKTLAFKDKWDICQVPTTRTTPAIGEKTVAKQEVLQIVRKVIGMLQSSPLVSDPQRQELGIPIRDVDPTPVGLPTHAPAITNLVVTGRTLTGRLRDAADANNRGRPLGVAGATIFSFTGDEPPVLLTDWDFQGTQTRTKFAVEFPASTLAGTKVWVTAYWRNPTDEAGPAAVPISMTLAGGLPQVA
jgi:hypothetical protein